MIWLQRYKLFATKLFNVETQTCIYVTFKRETSAQAARDAVSRTEKRRLEGVETASLFRRVKRLLFADLTYLLQNEVGGREEANVGLFVRVVHLHAIDDFSRALHLDTINVHIAPAITMTIVGFDNLIFVNLGNSTNQFFQHWVIQIRGIIALIKTLLQANRFPNVSYLSAIVGYLHRFIKQADLSCRILLWMRCT